LSTTDEQITSAILYELELTSECRHVQIELLHCVKTTEKAK